MSAVRALISVSDKTGIVEFAQALARHQIDILSTGGTARLLIDAGVPVTEVSSYTGFPEIMGGRVKTLHPTIHGGILGRRGTDDATMQQHGIDAIDFVVVNLYPFAETVAKPDCDLAMAIENIDIGGPAMLRAAAKNHSAVTVICNPADYAPVLAELGAQREISAATRFRLATAAFTHTAEYDRMISEYLRAFDSSPVSGVDGSESARSPVTAASHESTQEAQESDPLPARMSLHLAKVQDLRYGENPQQAAALYSEDGDSLATADAVLAAATITGAESVQGKPLSYNNIADADAALECVKQFAAPACVIVKHANPCGVAVAENCGLAYERAWACDPESAFGGIIACNRVLEGELVKLILEQQFVEVLIAPGFDAHAIDIMAGKPALRALKVSANLVPDQSLRLHRVSGGVLVQQTDNVIGSTSDTRVVTQRQPTAAEWDDLWFAEKVAAFVKSNAIVYARENQTVGIGAGQMSRVNSARIAAIKAEEAGLQVAGCVMASDAFFPFRDGMDRAASVGIKAVIQPGGSRNDKEVIAAADEFGMAMVFTGKRHFRH